MFVIVVGNVDEVVGPFEEELAAIEWATSQYGPHDRPDIDWNCTIVTCPFAAT